MAYLMMREFLLKWCGFDGLRLLFLTGNEIQRTGLLDGNPPLRWGAPGDDLATAVMAVASADFTFEVP
jgi:hypothetical protein